MQQRTKSAAKKSSSTRSAKAESTDGFAEELAGHLRTILGKGAGLGEKKMFGGIGFMLHGNLLASASRRGLLVRVGKDRQHEALAWPNSRPMVMRGRVMEGYVRIDPSGTSAEAVRTCVGIAYSFVATLPKK